MSAGIDYVDVPEVKRRNIPIGYTPQVLDNAVADMAVGLMIAAGRRFHEGRVKIETWVKALNIRLKSYLPILYSSQWSGWGPQWMLGKDITDSVVGIVGLGNIGQKIAKRLQGFDIGQILYTARSEKPHAKKEFNAKFVTFEELITKSDYVIISVPLTNDTKGMFNQEVFKKMKETSVLGKVLF